MSSTHLRPQLDFYYCQTVLGLLIQNTLSDDREGSVVYNCCWSSPAQSFSGLSPAGLMIISYCLRFETSPTWRARSPYLYPPGTGWPSYTPQHWVPFSSPPTTQRAMVGLFELASTQGPTDYQSQSYFTSGGLLPISSSWRQALWGSRPEICFLQVNSCGQNPYVTSSVRIGWVCLLWIGFGFVKYTYRTCSISLHDYGRMPCLPGNRSVP
jgi:hypothetical protein